MEINEEVLAKAIAYANILLGFPSGDEYEKREARRAVLNFNAKDEIDWPWGCAVRAYYDGVQSVYSELEAAHNEMMEKLNADTIPAGPSEEFEL